MKRMTALILAAMLLVSIFAGCGTAPEPMETGVATSRETEPATPPPTEETIPPEAPQPMVAADLSISEVMPDNRKLTLGHGLDWVELYNPETFPVDLSGYYLTDDLSDPHAMPLTGLQISAEGYLAVSLDTDASFQLSRGGETVYLTCGGEVISQLSFSAPGDGESFDAAGACTYPTPGYANTQDGYTSYLENLTLPELIITEVLPVNSAYLPVRYEYYDLVEVYNNSAGPVDLAQYTLSDSYEQESRYAFPDVTLEPGEYYVVYCSGDTALGDAHAGFKLGTGETVYLAKNGMRTDCLTIPADLKNNESFGRSGNTPVYLKSATFGAANTEGYLTGIAVPRADVESGLYTEAVTVALSGEGTIYYTLDGSRPTTASRVYREPITVSDVTTIRCFCASHGRSSPVTAYTYVIGKEHDLPVVVLQIPQDSLTGETGVLNHIEDSFEHEGVLTLIEEGQEQFSIPCGFRLHGNDSRKGLKQNFSLRFRAEYGAGKLEYRLFDDRNIDEFDSLLLKGGSEDWWKAMLRDELATEIPNGTTNLYTQAVKPVVLYLGGRYWGIYYFRERFSDVYVAEHMGVSPESVDMVYSTGAYDQFGSGADFRELRNYARTHDMSTPENYAYLQSQIDVVSLMDWYICRSYIGDKDIANIRRFRSAEDDGKWRWMFFDLDWGFSWTGDKPLSSIVDSGADTALIQAVFSNPVGLDAFLKRYAYLMDTVLNEEYVMGVMDSIIADIRSEIPRDRARWGRTVAEWEDALEYLRDFFADGARNKHVLKDLKSYFSLSDEEMQYYFGDRYQ